MQRESFTLVTAVAVAAFLAPGAGAATTDTSESQESQTSQTSAPTESKPAASGAVADGPLALRGAAAAAYRLPADVERVWRASYPEGTTQTRYQQVVNGAEVLGGQVTVFRNAAGETTSVVGAHFRGLEPTNSVRLSGADARAKAVRTVGERGTRSSTLRLDPRDGRLYYEVETQRFAHRWIQWIDATSGEIDNTYDAVAEGEGVGVKGDRKTIDTTQANGVWQLLSADGRQKTYDAKNGTTLPGDVMTDADNVWDLQLPGSPSPSQPPGVDAHYYANVVDDFYGDIFSRNSIDDAGMQIISTVHFDVGYCNAFWNGEQMTYGDGDGTACLPLSGGLDVVSHELTHGVTEFTSGLIYENESGALNEAFSDMMGNTAEFYADRNGLDPAAEPDWLIGEDVIPAGVYGGAEAGFRNMGDPRADGDPDHYSELYTGPRDNGGVHSNSGIPNHAYYLAVNGGRNAGCDNVASSGHRHATDCSVQVKGIGLDRTQQIFYKGFTSLTEYANMCDARSATMAVSGRSKKTINAAWAAVGVKAGCAPGIPPPPPCVSDANAQIPFESPHPYGNNGDCTWTYDNGQAGFRFHFDLLETEATYDYVYVYDANGNQLARYDGPHPLGQTSPCITTQVGSVRLTTDPAVIDQGFRVDAVQPC